MNTFEHLDPGCNGSPQHSEIMLQHGYHHLPHDDMPNSVGSDFPTTPSELSSPMSQWRLLAEPCQDGATRDCRVLMAWNWGDYHALVSTLVLDSSLDPMWPSPHDSTMIPNGAPSPSVVLLRWIGDFEGDRERHPPSISLLLCLAPNLRTGSAPRGKNPVRWRVRAHLSGTRGPELLTSLHPEFLGQIEDRRCAGETKVTEDECLKMFRGHIHQQDSLSILEIPTSALQLPVIKGMTTPKLSVTVYSC